MPIWRVLVLALLLTACAETSQHPLQATTPLPPNAPVLLFRGMRPRSVEYEGLGTIVVRKATAIGDRLGPREPGRRGSQGGNQCDHGGADGLCLPLLGTWVAPKGTGIAVRITAPRLEDVWLRTGIQGERR